MKGKGLEVSHFVGDELWLAGHGEIPDQAASKVQASATYWEDGTHLESCCCAQSHLAVCSGAVRQRTITFL